MRKLSAALMVALAAVVWAAPRAADAKAEPKDARAGLAERLQDLDLTDAQEAKITDIREDYRPRVQEAAKELATAVKDEMEKVQGVLTGQQKDKLRTFKDDRQEHREECLAHALANLKELDLTDAEMTKIGEIRKEFRPKIEKALDGLNGLLGDDQKKARETALNAGKKRKEVL